MTKRAAIYARFSTDLQNERSIEDQVTLCRKHVGEHNLTVVATYEDRARSGASVLGRDGLLELMDAARSGRIDIVLVEALDRLSRDQADLSAIYKRLDFAGIAIHAVHDGRADVVQIGIRGLVGQLYLKDLAEKVHRGMAGVIRDGRYPGGRAYGYCPVPGEPGRLAIDVAQAETVRRIFTEYVAGKSPRGIAIALNKDGVTPPRGPRWNASTINGNKARGHGILQNPLYAGRIVWNRVRMVRDPDTGKRISRPNPREEWREAEAPELAIIAQSVWEKAQQRKQARTHVTQRGRTPGKSYLLRGLLRCGYCGGSMNVADHNNGRTRIECASAKNAGTCKIRKRVSLNDIEDLVLNGLRQTLDDPAYLAEYVKTYNEERRLLAADKQRRRSRAQTRISRAEAGISRLIDALADGRLAADTVADKVEALEAEKQQATSELHQAGEAPNVIALHPETIRQYRCDLDLLADRLAGIDGDREAHEALHRLISRVEIHHGEVPVTINIEGRLSALTGGQLLPKRRLGESMVAEEGLEPPTHGL